MFQFLVVFLVLAKLGDAKHKHKDVDLGWDRLVVTFKIFSIMPISVKKAVNEGWTKDGSCKGGDKNIYVGNRYIQKGDKSTRLIFDNKGDIAGIQVTIKPTKMFPPRRNSPWIMANKNEAMLTAYFQDPKYICKKGKKKKPAGRIGNELYIQANKDWLCKGGHKKILKIPQNERALKDGDQPWVRGKCFTEMGRHYWYDISPKSSCQHQFPVFLMYDETSKLLKGFGWAINTDISSPRWLHPTEEVFRAFIRPNTIPTCLASQSISTQHIYFSDPLKMSCTKPAGK